MKPRYDIAVIGGGLSGFVCALTAAERGKSVLLVDRRPAFGWECTWACQLEISGSSLPITRRILGEIERIGGIKSGTGDAPIIEITLDKIARDTPNLTPLMYSYPARLVSEGDSAFGVVLGSKSGEQIVKAAVIVDATEDAFLWRQSGIEFNLSPKVRGRQVIYFNNVEDDLELPLDLGDEIVVKPSIWKGEVRVEFTAGDIDLIGARLMMPHVVSRVRESVPQLKDALVSHVGNELFPIEPMVSFGERTPEHPRIRNLLGAGVWSIDSENTPVSRLEIGERVGAIAAEMEGVKEFPEELHSGSVLREPQDETDVIVVGGGTSGPIAAIAAGRQGAKVTLIEASTSLGGIGTGGAIHSYCVGLSGGIQDEVDQRVAEMTPLFAGKWKVSGFHPEVKKIVLQQMVNEAGVKTLFNTVLTGVILENDRVQLRGEPGTSVAVRDEEHIRQRLTGIVAVGPEGVRIHRAKVFVDSTGDGDVAVMSGAPYIIGRDTDNLMHAYSQPAGRVLDNGQLGFLNFDVGYVDPTDVEDLTRGRIHGTVHYWREDFNEKNRLTLIAPIIGLRQSRHIIGDYQITLADEIAGRRFPDVVSFMRTFYDNHGFDYENESDEAMLWVWALGNWRKTIGCDVPYRSLLPKNVDGLLVACRALSMTFDAHAGFRMQRDLQRVGEAAGVAAAMAAKAGVTPRQVDLKKLQAILKESGVLDEKYRIEPAIPERPVLQAPDEGEIDPEQAKDLVWLSSHRGEEGIAVLKKLLNASDEKVRFRASAALAMRGSSEGVDELLRQVKTKNDVKTDGNKAVPVWQAAISFLGMAGDRRAVPELSKILLDKDANLGAITAAVRSLGKIGDESAADAIRQMLKRDDLPTVRTLQVSTGGVKQVSEDARWQIELAAAEALGRLNAPPDEVKTIVQPYLNDERAYVRRYARRVLQEAGIAVE